jgi:hypothetical protein
MSDFKKGHAHNDQHIKFFKKVHKPKVMFHATLAPEILAPIYLPQLLLLKWGMVKYSGVSLPATGGMG